MKKNDECTMKLIKIWRRTFKAKDIEEDTFKINEVERSVRDRIMSNQKKTRFVLKLEARSDDGR